MALKCRPEDLVNAPLDIAFGEGDEAQGLVRYPAGFLVHLEMDMLIVPAFPFGHPVDVGRPAVHQQHGTLGAVIPVAAGLHLAVARAGQDQLVAVQLAAAGKILIPHLIMGAAGDGEGHRHFFLARRMEQHRILTAGPLQLAHLLHNVIGIPVVAEQKIDPLVIHAECSRYRLWHQVHPSALFHGLPPLYAIRHILQVQNRPVWFIFP